MPSTNENINYDSLAKSPTSQLQEIAWIGKTNRGLVRRTVDLILRARLSPLPSTNENINYDSLAKVPNQSPS